MTYTIDLFRGKRRHRFPVYATPVVPNCDENGTLACEFLS